MSDLLDIARAAARAHKQDPEPAEGGDEPLPTDVEKRRQRVLQLVWSNPALKYAVHSDDATADPVMLAVAIRRDDSAVSFEVAIPKAKYDGMALLEMVEKSRGTQGPELAVIKRRGSA